MELLLHRENFLYHSRLQEEIRCGTMKKMRGGRRMFFWMDTLFPVFFFAITAIVVATFVVMFVKGIRDATAGTLSLLHPLCAPGISFQGLS